MGGQGAGAADGGGTVLFAEAVHGAFELFAPGAGFDGQIEEIELAGGIGFDEVGDAEADKADGLFEGNFLEEGGGHGLEIFFDAGGAGKGALAGQGGEVLPTDLEASGGGEAAVGAEAAGDIFDEFEEGVVKEVAGAFVTEEGVFAGDGFFADIEFDFARIVAEGEAAQVGGAVGADDAFEQGGGGVLEVADGVEGGAVEGLAGDLADAPEAGDGEGAEEGDDAGAVERQHGQAVGLAVFGAELGEEFIGGDTDGAGEGEFGADVVSDAAGDGFAAAEQAQRAGDVEEGFVNGEAFDEGGIAFEDGEDLVGDGTAGGGACRGEEDGGRAAAAGVPGGHGGMNAGAGFVGGGGDDASLVGRSADGDGLAAVFGVVALLDGGT